MFVRYDQMGVENGPIMAIYRSGNVVVAVPANWDNKAAEADAAQTALQDAFQGKQVQQYAIAFAGNAKRIFSAFRAFHEGFRTASATPTLAEYRQTLGSTLAIILTMPAGFTDELASEQKALGLPGAPTSAWTLVQCQQWHQLLGGWLGRAMAGAVGALMAELD